MNRTNAGRRASEQMSRDGIRRLKPAQRTVCGHVINPGDLVVLGCSKTAGYATPAGNRCFAHTPFALASLARSANA